MSETGEVALGEHCGLWWTPFSFEQYGRGRFEEARTKESFARLRKGNLFEE